MLLFKKKMQKCCTVKTIKRRLPITQWLPKYSVDDLVGDFIAGLTVGLTIVPQGIAFAFIAGLPPNYGLYSSFMSSFLYVIFGSCKQNSVGPTVVMALLTYEYARGNPELANLLCLSSGVLIFLFGIFNLGFLITFLAKPVVLGFATLVAINVASSQLKSLFGLKIKTDGLVDTWVKTYQHIGGISWPDFILGTISIMFLVALMKLQVMKRFKTTDDDAKCKKIVNKMVFLACAAKNAIVVIIAASVAMFLNDQQPFTLTGDITPGLPSFQLPSFTLNNGTTSFLEIISTVGSGIIVIPLVSILEGIAISEAFARGKTVDTKQELLALGICNVASSFVQSFPNAGAITRACLNHSSGVRTTGGGVVTGIFVILSLIVMMPYCRYIPRSSLAAVLICSSLPMIKYKEIIPMWRVRKADLLVFWVTFLSCLFWKLENGIVVGAIFNLFISIMHFATPKVHIFTYFENGIRTPHIVVEPRLGILYFNVDNLRRHINKAGVREGKGTLPIVVNCSHFSLMDYSGAKGMASLCTDFKGRSQALFFLNPSPGVSRALQAVNKNVKIIDNDNMIDNLHNICCKAFSHSANMDSKDTEEKDKLLCTKGDEEVEKIDIKIN